MGLGKKWTWVALAGILFSTVVPRTKVRADDEVDEPEEQQFPEGHADCIFFGPQRERFVKGGALEAARRAEALAQLTNDVAAALGPLPSRSRSGALRQPGLPGQPPRGVTQIDRVLFTAMKENGVTPADPASDQEF